MIQVQNAIHPCYGAPFCLPIPCTKPTSCSPSPALMTVPQTLMTPVVLPFISLLDTKLFSLEAKEAKRLSRIMRGHRPLTSIIWAHCVSPGTGMTHTFFTKLEAEWAVFLPKGETSQYIFLLLKLFLVPASVSSSKQFKELPEFIASTCSNFDKIHDVMWKEIHPVPIVPDTQEVNSETGCLLVWPVPGYGFEHWWSLWQ